MKRFLCGLFGTFTICLTTVSFSQEDATVNGPAVHVFDKPGGVELKLYVFAPKATAASDARAGIVLFHGGGWEMGEPAWAFDRAQHFAQHGMVAVSAQYRLSDHKEITPLDAIDDARAAVRWVRSHAKDLGIDPNRIAAYGWSAGAHLATCTAVFVPSPEKQPVSCAPNALVLESPAVAIASDAWVQNLLGSKCKSSEISPDRHIHSGLPPTVIVQGREDTVTPLSGVQQFCDRMKAAGNHCELYVFNGVGHMLTPVGIPDFQTPKPDPVIEKAAFSTLDSFLVSMGYMR